MNKMIKTDKRSQIAQLLLEGENPQSISKKLSCDIFMVTEVLRDEKFISVSKEQLTANVQSASLSALRVIVDISKDEKASTATRLKASQYIVDKATEYNASGQGNETPSTMTQEQLAKRYADFEAEILKRAKPVKSKVITQSIEDML